MEEAEVIVVGGGPAGSSCARECARLGLDCLVLDRAEFPRLKRCAGWITPACARDLELAGYPHAVTAYDRFHLRVRGRQVRLRTRQYAIRRVELDAWLLARSGARVARHHVRAVERRPAGGFVLDGRYACRVLVGAGGTACPVRRRLFAGLRPRPERLLIAALEAEFPHAWRDPRCALWFAEDGLPGYSWCVPKEGGHLNLGLGGYAARLTGGATGLREHWGRFLARLRERGLLDGPEPACGGHAYHLRHGSFPASADGVYVVGDAADLATRDLGEGIGPAVRSGILAARAIKAGRPLSFRPVPRLSLPGMVLAGLGLGRSGDPLAGLAAR